MEDRAGGDLLYVACLLLFKVCNYAPQHCESSKYDISHRTPVTDSVYPFLFDDTFH